MTLQVGETIGQYEIIGQIGSGGMATVYKAYHKKLDRHVAIKLMHDTFIQDDNFLARFQREARIVARLEHPHIVPVYDYAESGDRPYLVMKYIDGGTLKRRLIKRGITLDEIKTMMTLLADSLTYAHEKDVLHRDIKPSNILIDDRDLPYITDFGLARIAQVGESTISHDMMLGTPFYISPEQAKGDKNLTPTTDIYSFGIILYELLVGTVPFTADTPYAIVHEHIYNKPTPPSHINKDLTSAIDDVILKALAKNPTHRYQTAIELMTAFKTALDTSGVTQLPPDRSVVQKTPKPQAPSLPSVPRIDSEQAIRSPQMNYTYNKKGRKVRIEGAWDMSNFNMNDIKHKLDKSIRSGVDYISDIAEQIEGKIKSSEPQLTQEELIRLRIEKKLHARREIVQHLFVYVVVNSLLWFLYLSSIDAMSIFSGTPMNMIDFGFPWPLLVNGFWGIGIVMQYIEYHYKHGGGADKREAEIEQEITRQMRLSQMREMERNKGTYAPDDNVDAEVFDIDHIEARRVRLNDEGELTDSFIQEADAGQQRRQ